jgi:thioredoxin 2
MGPTFVPCEQCGHVNRVGNDAQGRTPLCGSCKARLDNFHDGVIEVSGTGLTHLVKASPIPVIVDCWADWCGPCKAFAPVFGKLARERFGDAVFAKLNTDSHQLAAQAHGIRGIPTVIVFHKGLEISRQTGALPERAFREMLDEVVRETAAAP